MDTQPKGNERGERRTQWRGVYVWTRCNVRWGMGFDIMAFLGYSGAIWCMAYVLASWNFWIGILYCTKFNQLHKNSSLRKVYLNIQIYRSPLLTYSPIFWAFSQKFSENFPEISEKPQRILQEPYQTSWYVSCITPPPCKTHTKEKTWHLRFRVLYLVCWGWWVT